jgi:hypothetical protein
MLTGVALLISVYGSYATAQLALLPTSTLTRAAEKAASLQLWESEAFFMLAYLLQPLSTAFLFLTLEGSFRAIAAVGTTEVIPSFRFYIVSLLHTRLGSW